MTTTHTKRWIIPPELPFAARQALQKFPPILQQILYNRGYPTDAQARAYLRAQVDFDTNPLQMLDMEKATRRIRTALQNKEKIAIYGDYDVDGVTATALLLQTLQFWGADVRGYIPNRFEEGYGINNEALSALQAEGVSLVISVDCGIRSPQEALHAQNIGLTLIISDHHHPDVELPAAYAVINPKREGDPYPEKDLAGVGIAYKIAQALGLPPEQLEALTDLVALGTVADLAPLTGENRLLVRAGLRCLRATSRQGIFSLAQVAGLKTQRITATDIGFGLGPRLNAAGRLESALASLTLLTTSDLFTAGQLAQQLDSQNRERQKITRQIQEQAEAQARAEDPNADLMFAVHPEFNAGVVGLAASRLVEAFYRPAVVGQVGEDFTRCSCRSIPEFHITQALDECKDLLLRHGGHAAAAGFTVSNENVPALRQRLRQIATLALQNQDLRASLSADMQIPLAEMKPEVLKHLDYLQPTGYGNPDAVFVSRAVTVKNARKVGSDGKHLKLTVTDSQVTFDAIAFRLGDLQPQLTPGTKIDLMYTLEQNEYNGRTSLQLNVKDLKPAGIPDS